MRDGADRVSEALFGTSRRGILALLFGHPGREYYAREIARKLDLSPGAVQPELVSLSEAGLLVRTRRGKQVFYRANSASPVFDEIRGLMEKTAGLADVLRAELAELATNGRIDVAFVYGSVAAGRQDSASDVDLMLVGAATLTEAVPALRSASDRIGREVNPTLYSAAELQDRLRRGEHFVTRVLAEPKIFVIGTTNELDDLVGTSLAD